MVFLNAEKKEALMMHTPNNPAKNVLLYIFVPSDFSLHTERSRKRGSATNSLQRKELRFAGGET